MNLYLYFGQNFYLIRKCTPIASHLTFDNIVKRFPRVPTEDDVWKLNWTFEEQLKYKGKFEESFK